MKRYLQSNCPFCGHKMLVTSHGYKCESCGFTFPLFVCNRHISEEEACDVINGNRVALDGFSSNDGKIFSSIVVIEGRSVRVDNTVCYCQKPAGGGRIVVKKNCYACMKKSSCVHSNCKFPFKRWYNGHRLTVPEVIKLTQTGEVQFCAVDDDGEVFGMTLSNNFSQTRKLVPQAAV